MSISGFETYKIFITYKSHFGNNKTNVKNYKYRIFSIPYSRFLKTKGIHFYDSIAKKIKTEKKIVNLFISAFLNDPSTGIFEIAQNIKYYMALSEERENRINNMPYLFKKDCMYLKENNMKFSDTLGSFLLNEFMESKIELETFMIFLDIFKFNLDNNQFYEYIYRGKYEKYSYLLRIDSEHYKQILEEVIMNWD